MAWITDNLGTLLFFAALAFMLWMHRPGGHGGCGHPGHEHDRPTDREAPDGRN